MRAMFFLSHLTLNRRIVYINVVIGTPPPPPYKSGAIIPHRLNLPISGKEHTCTPYLGNL